MLPSRLEMCGLYRSPKRGITCCAVGGQLDVQLVYKMASRSMVRRIIVLLCGALAKDLRDYIVIKKSMLYYS